MGSKQRFIWCIGIQAKAFSDPNKGQKGSKQRSMEIQVNVFRDPNKGRKWSKQRLKVIQAKACRDPSKGLWGSKQPNYEVLNLYILTIFLFPTMQIIHLSYNENIYVSQDNEIFKIYNCYSSPFVLFTSANPHTICILFCDIFIFVVQSNLFILISNKSFTWITRSNYLVHCG
jgi:hypothetical protein